MENKIFIVQYAAEREHHQQALTQVGYGVKLRGQEATSLQFEKKLV